MRTATLSAMCLLFAASCAGHRPPVFVPIMRYVMVETLPDETEVCVRRDPFREELACLTLGEFRQIVRGIRRASLP